MSHGLGIGRIYGTPAEREIVNGIQQIGLAHTIMAYKAVQPVGKIQVSLDEIAVILYKKMLKYHNFRQRLTLTGCEYNPIFSFIL